MNLNYSRGKDSYTITIEPTKGENKRQLIKRSYEVQLAATKKASKILN